jgi:hypothetical protein
MLAGNILKYIHLQRRNAPDLTYLVEITTNLVSGAWLPFGAGTQTNITGGEYDLITNNLTIQHPQCYIRLKITKP